MYLYFLNKQNIKLSAEEVLALSKKNSNSKLSNNCLLLDELVDYKRLAYTKKVFQLLFETTNKNLLKSLKEFDFNNYYKESFKLSTTNNQSFKLSELADIIWDNIINPVVNLKNTKTVFEIIFLENKVFVCKELFEQKEDFENRRAHLRPSNHPTSLHPRLARCLINLANSKEILDPFCGSAGLLLEAGLLKIKIISI